MDRQQISLKLALDALGESLALESFDERMALQKIIYLTQHAGVHLGYRYNWYLRGPYSPELTRDAFEMKSSLASGSDELTGWKLDEPSVQALKRLATLWRDKQPGERPRWLELLASVLFLKQSYLGRGSDTAGLREILRRYDKQFEESEINTALGQLRSYGLLSTP